MPRTILVGRATAGRSWWFSPDGRTLAVGRTNPADEEDSDAGEITIWNISDPARPARITTPRVLGDAVVFSPDRRLMAVGLSTGGGNSVTLWNMADPADVQRLPTTPLNGTVVGFALGGAALVVATTTSQALWDLTDPNHPARIRTPRIAGDSVLVDDITLVSGERSDPVTVWDLGALAALRSDPQRVACERLGGRGLSAAEWKQFVPGVEYLDTCP